MVVSNVEIFSGDAVAKELSENDLRTLADAWTEHQLGPVPEFSLRERFREAFSTGSRKAEGARRKMFSDGMAHHFREAMVAGDMVIAKENGQVVGMVRVRKLDTVGEGYKDQGDIIELGKAIVLPKQRGRGIYPLVRAEAIRHTINKYGDVAILTGTKNDRVKELNRTDGWKEIGFAEYMKIHGYPEEQIATEAEDYQKKGWTAFLRTPEKTEQTEGIA